MMKNNDIKMLSNPMKCLSPFLRDSVANAFYGIKTLQIRNSYGIEFFRTKLPEDTR